MGLSHFNIKTGKFTNYNTSDGIISNEFRRGAYFKSASGEIFFGGANGVVSFRPFTADKIHPLLNLVFTDLFVYSKPVALGSEILKEPLETTKEVELPFDVKNFSIGFSAIEFNSPGKVIYEVMLENLDDKWITQPLNSNVATYTNLKPGKYVFHVKAYLPGGPVSERTLVIRILPPLWLTWWAKTIYFIIAIMLVYMGVRIAREKMRVKKENIDKANEKRIMESKIQFFTDISHEIRTPLTLILSPIEHLISKTDNPDLKKTYNRIDQNGKRILRLINQIMELRKLDNSEMRLHAVKTDFRKFLETIYLSFSQIAEEKHIDYTISVGDNIPEITIDRDKIDKVIFNVLSNAFKYTPEEGSISVSASTSEEKLIVRITDSGCGIPEQYRKAIFERFYRVPSDDNRSKLGTGIGLHLSHKLMELHHGKIYVDDASENGTTFVIEIPLNPSYLKPEEIGDEDITPSLATLNQPSIADYYSNAQSDKEQSGGKGKHSLLLVEDNDDMLDYLKEILKSDYRIFCAKNGKEGLEMAIKELPDCVVTDIMMPEMNGTDMCRKIKQNPTTCDIPVIILTAKTSIEQRVEGLQDGADSYIPKPFNVDHLKTRIAKLIELRLTMRNKYSGKLDIDEESVKVKSADEKLIERVESFVHKELSNPDLSVEMIASEIGVSRSHLHRRLKQLTNQNPSDYIKNTRLRHAAYLLANKSLSISEACYATGFSSLSHFSNSFKEFYGVSPTKYVEINRDKPTE